ncbi:hypothetical protein EI53_01014 [Fusobacterium naviforme]|uniref:Uncharacterized protein n=1 Tax=Moryella indoligenes TaxID=371674 RepID=A0AAE4AKC8_9FIRM|nr:hypothetical protein [Moryella indoligenes]KAB0577580.1 hypothetical protein F7P78_05065 [Fusobacterium naviforme]MDQ0152753.1 hypothetical protein [Moryella indoligenes]PSL10393.1 hypothetical protein EI53_01014 [Fusobacterium naviforme]STO28091.1 Uncharacterised protein [Fusobacterium naviforme]
MIITKVLLVILAILIVALVAFYFYGRKLQERQAAQQPAFEAAKQTVSMLVIDKKKLRISEAGFPKIVSEQTPWYMRWMKVPVVKAKVGPKILTLMSDEKVFQQLPMKQECKVVVSGIYIAELKSVRGGIPTVAKKRSLMDRILGRNK